MLTGCLVVGPNRSSHQRCSVKKDVLRNFAKFTGKQLCQGLFFNKFAGLGPATLLKMGLWHKCFPVNFAKFLRTHFLQNNSRRLLVTKGKKIKCIPVIFQHSSLTYCIPLVKDKAVCMKFVAQLSA